VRAVAFRAVGLGTFLLAEKLWASIAQIEIPCVPRPFRASFDTSRWRRVVVTPACREHASYFAKPARPQPSRDARNGLFWPSPSSSFR